MGPKPPEENELLWQFRNFFRFYWVSGGLFAEMDIHQIDEICWLKDALPVQAHGIGGRVVDSTDCSQNLDSFAIEWTFADGTKATDVVRYVSDCHNDFATYVHGTKCAAQFSGMTHAGDVQRYRDQRIAKDNIAWKAPDEQLTAWQAEWAALFNAIRQDQPHNEARRAAESNLVDMMGRAAVHSGQIVTWDEVMASNFQFCPDIDQMNYDTPPPVLADAARSLSRAGPRHLERNLTHGFGNGLQVVERAGQRQSALGADQRQPRRDCRGPRRSTSATEPRNNVCGLFTLPTSRHWPCMMARLRRMSFLLSK